LSEQIEHFSEEWRRGAGRRKFFDWAGAARQPLGDGLGRFLSLLFERQQARQSPAIEPEIHIFDGTELRLICYFVLWQPCATKGADYPNLSVGFFSLVLWQGINVLLW
jgi:hypothetical protein